METKTHFDLTGAIENWRQELASQSQLSAEDQSELKTHLSDAVTELQKRGLSAEKSFWLARRRVGHPQQLGLEFNKENPATVWRERVLWMAVATLVISQWGLTSMPVFWAVQNLKLNFTNVWIAQLLVFAWYDLPPMVLMFFLSRGTGRVFSLLTPLFQSRRRFVSIAAVWIVINASLALFPHFANNHDFLYKNNMVIIWTNVVSASAWSLALVVLIALLMQNKNKRPLQLA